MPEFRYFVRNKRDNPVTEKKPMVGEFTIPAKGRVEFPKDIAEALVNDFLASGLSLEIEEVPLRKKVLVNSGERKKNK